MGMNDWNAAISNMNRAQKFTSLIGREQRTTAKGVGRLHSLSVITKINHQETDGAANYHECKEFDKALSIAVKNNFKALKTEALLLLQDEVKRTGNEARESVQNMLDQIDAYENT